MSSEAEAGENGRRRQEPAEPQKTDNQEENPSGNPGPMNAQPGRDLHFVLQSAGRGNA
jgi:hypothetical protein